MSKLPHKIFDEVLSTRNISMTQLICSIFLLSLLLRCCDDLEAQIRGPVFINLFSSCNLEVNSCYRIPSIVNTSSGTLIAAIDERNGSCKDLKDNNDINIVIRTSIDDGKTWSTVQKIVDYPYGESASDPSMILDEVTGKVFLFFNYMNLNMSKEQYHLRYIYSRNSGLSWSKPVDITSQVSKPDWTNDFKFITSGRGIQTNNGTLLHTLVNLDNGLYVFGSYDLGASWFIKETPIKPGDESKIIELTNGDWMINSRVNNSGMRYTHVSSDDGQTWVSKPEPTLRDPSCNASIIRYNVQIDGEYHSCILFSNLNSVRTRENLSIRISCNEGTTWSEPKTIYQGSSAYSTMCILSNGDIGLFFEKDNYQENVFARISSDWIKTELDIESLISSND